MKKYEIKAQRLVLGDKVRVNPDTIVFHDDGRLDEALGFVIGDSGKTWMVHIEGDATSCDCPNGTNRRDAGGHSHDLALRLAAMGYRAAKEEQACP